jgi:hypothetical protein
LHANPVEALIQEGGDDVLRAGDALLAEVWASLTVASLGDTAAERTGLVEAVLACCQAARTPQASVAARSLAAVSSGADATRAAQVAAALDAVPLPPWVASIGAAQPAAARRHGTTVHLLFRYPGGEAHTLTASPGSLDVTPGDAGEPADEGGAAIDLDQAFQHLAAVLQHWEGGAGDDVVALAQARLERFRQDAGGATR